MSDLLGALLGNVACFVLPLALLVFGVGGYIIWRRSRTPSTEEQLSALNQMIEGSEWRPASSDADAAAAEKKAARLSLTERLDNAISSRGFGGRVRAQLRKADLKLTVSEYYVLHGVLAVGLGLVGYIFFRTESGLPDARIAIPFIAGFFIPRIYVGSRQKKRLKDFNNQLADILGLWVNALRAGYSVPQAMEAVSRESPQPAGEEFKRVVAEMAIGVPIETALNNMLSRIESEDLDLVFTAVNIQREVGGNLAEILDTISHTIRERVRIKGEISVLTASGRATGMLIGFLPVGLSIFLYIINPSYMGQLFLGPPIGANIPGLPIPCGWPMVAVAVVMLAIGLAVIRRIVDIEV